MKLFCLLQKSGISEYNKKRKIILNKIIKRLIFTSNIFILFVEFCLGQESVTSIPPGHQLGLGAMVYSNDEYLISASWGRQIKNNNEWVFPVYFEKSFRTKALCVSTALNWATTKKQSRFIFYLSPEFNLHFDSQPRFSSGTNIYRYGYFACLGLIPSLKITPTIKVQIELKLGHGYLWGVNNKHISLGTKRDIEEAGWIFRNLSALRINYYF